MDSSRILFGAGLGRSYFDDFKTVLTPGDKIVTSEGTFGQYYHNAIVESAEVVQVPLLNGGFDLENIIKEVDEETALVWLCNPNNPTGTYFNHDELEKLFRTRT